ncbi:MAG: hypothetical protein AAF944_27330 [Bacteroidota bacterium]
MQNLVIKQNQKLNKMIFRSTWLFILALAISSNLYAQFGLDPNKGDSKWEGSNGKIYTLSGKVGIGTSNPARMLDVIGGSNKYIRLTSEGGNQYANTVAGLELKRTLQGGQSLTWDVVNQGTFKIRRNTNTLFILDQNAGQFGTETNKLTLNVVGKFVSGGNNNLNGGALALRYGNSTLRMDSEHIESDQSLFINYLSEQGIRMARVGDVGIGLSDDAGAKLGIRSEDWQLNLINHAKSWKIGVSNSDWAVGEGKLVFSNQDSSTDALMVMTQQGRVGIGMRFPDRTLDVNGTTRTRKLEIIGGADLAEPFEVSEANIQPGTVVVIDPANAGQLKMATAAYDKTVAGIVSGAGNIQPGMVMGQDGSIASGEHPVALSGRVYAKVDASYGAIQPGDLLTTSDTPGYAMRANNHHRAQGAVIGKAMTALEEGQGLVLVLISLQ